MAQEAEKQCAWINKSIEQLPMVLGSGELDGKQAERLLDGYVRRIRKMNGTVDPDHFESIGQTYQQVLPKLNQSHPKVKALTGLLHPARMAQYRLSYMDSLDGPDAQSALAPQISAPTPEKKAAPDSTPASTAATASPAAPTAPTAPEVSILATPKAAAP